MWTFARSWVTLGRTPRPLCIIDDTVAKSVAKSHRVIGKSICLAGLWVFLFGLRPRSLLLPCFSAGEMQIWLGDLRVVVVFVLCFLPCLLICYIGRPLRLADSIRVAAYSNVRTEPQSVIGRNRGKKNPSLFHPINVLFRCNLSARCGLKFF